jgi:hypothetical protein
MTTGILLLSNQPSQDLRDGCHSSYFQVQYLKFREVKSLIHHYTEKEDQVSGLGGISNTQHYLPLHPQSVVLVLKLQKRVQHKMVSVSLMTITVPGILKMSKNACETGR